jgi:signal peptidase I
MGSESQGPEPTPPWWQIVLVGRHPARTGARIVTLVVLSFGLYNFAFRPIRVKGISMLPTYTENRINCINLLAYRFHEPRRGDVVVIRLRAGDHVLLMKRIVGLPGETVGFHEGRVVINGEQLTESYEKLESDWERPAIQLQADEYYVVGDNRSMSQSEHEFGRVSRAQILGKVLL